jgi:hypothetical protein
MLTTLFRFPVAMNFAACAFVPAGTTPPVAVRAPVSGSITAVPAAVTTRVPKSRSAHFSTVSGLRRATLPVAGFATGAAETAAGAASDRTAAVERERDKPGNIADATIGLT